MIAEERTVVVKDIPVVLQTSSSVDVDSNIEKMKNYVDGEYWDGITYYKQIKDMDDVANPIDVLSHVTQQQYDKIENYRLKMVTPIDKDGEGEAVILHFRPQENDVFTAPLINGDVGLFTIDNIRIINYNNTDVFEVNFKLSSRKRTDPSIFSNLNEKVVETIYFDRESTYTNSSPLLRSQEWEFSKWLKLTVTQLSRYYIANFKDNRSGMLIVDNSVSIDTTVLFLNMSDPRDREIQDIDVPPYTGKTQQKLLLAIAGRDINLLLPTNTTCYNGHPNPMFKTVLYEGLDLRGSSIFGYDFLNGNPSTDLEKLIYGYIQNNSVNKDEFRKVIESIYNESTLIKYMVIPILMLICKEELRLNSSDIRR